MINGKGADTCNRVPLRGRPPAVAAPRFLWIASGVFDVLWVILADL